MIEGYFEIRYFPVTGEWLARNPFYCVCNLACQKQKDHHSTFQDQFLTLHTLIVLRQMYNKGVTLSSCSKHCALPLLHVVVLCNHFIEPWDLYLGDPPELLLLWGQACVYIYSCATLSSHDVDRLQKQTSFFQALPHCRCQEKEGRVRRSSSSRQGRIPFPPLPGPAWSGLAQPAGCQDRLL